MEADYAHEKIKKELARGPRKSLLTRFRLWFISLGKSRNG